MLATLKDDSSPLATLHEILAYHTGKFKTALVRHKQGFLDSKNLREHAAGIRATLELIVQYRKSFPDEGKDQPATVIRSPEPCTTTADWLAKYAPKAGSDSQKPAASPAIEELRQFAEDASEPPPKPKLVWNADQPPTSLADIDEATRDRLYQSLARRGRL